MKRFLLCLVPIALLLSETSLSKSIHAPIRASGVERAYSGEHVYRMEKGVYSCAGCGADLFKSEDKYDAGNGWPNFTQPIVSKNIYYLEDWALSFKRYEVLCRGCNAHLGHVFNDGPPPKNLRYCIHSIALIFKSF